MSEPTTTTSRVSRWRRILGICFVSLGILIALRSVWLAATFGSYFEPAEWLRFAFWLWIGTVLTLIGLWLRYRSQLAGWAALIAIPSFFLGGYFFTLTQ